MYAIVRNAKSSSSELLRGRSKKILSLIISLNALQFEFLYLNSSYIKMTNENLSKKYQIKLSKNENPYTEFNNFYFIEESVN